MLVPLPPPFCVCVWLEICHGSQRNFPSSLFYFNFYLPKTFYEQPNTLLQANMLFIFTWRTTLSIQFFKQTKRKNTVLIQDWAPIETLLIMLVRKEPQDNFIIRDDSAFLLQYLNQAWLLPFVHTIIVFAGVFPSWSQAIKFQPQVQIMFTRNLAGNEVPDELKLGSQGMGLLSKPWLMSSIPVKQTAKWNTCVLLC